MQSKEECVAIILPLLRIEQKLAHIKMQRNDLRRALQICRGEMTRKEEQHQLVTSVLIEKVRKYEQEVIPKMQELFDRVTKLECSDEGEHT